MDCKQFSNLLDALMEGSLPEQQAAAMHRHAEECDRCASLLSLRMDCRSLDRDVEIPPSFSQGWRQMIREENGMEKSSGMKKWQRWIAVAAAFLFVVGGTLVTREDLAAPADNKARFSYAVEEAMVAGDVNSNGTMARGMMYSAAPTAKMADSLAAENGANRQEKIIRNASFTIKSISFDQDLESIQALALEMGGRVEYLSTSGDKENGEMRHGSLTLRIPAEKLDAFLSGAQEIGHLTSLQQESQDVTESYYDVKARLETQQTKMERLQALLISAQDISDLIEIENSIADTQYQIDSYLGQLQNYDSKVDYSTVRVTLREIQVQEAEEISLGERMLGGLLHSLQSAGEFLRDCAVFLVAAAPWLAAGGIVIFAVVKIGKRRMKKGEKK